MPRLTPNRAPFLSRVAVAAALAGVALPAFAQQTVEGLTITGRYRVGEDVRSRSAAVPYSDLNLATAAGRDVLKQRVRTTARDLCAKLGESNSGPSAAPSCEQDAWSNARDQIKVAVADARLPNYVYIAPDEPYVAAVGPTSANASATVAQPTYTTTTVTNGTVPDTPTNRSQYGGPMSSGGQTTVPAGN